MIYVLPVNLPEPRQTAIRTLLATTADLMPVDETVETFYSHRPAPDDTPCIVILLEADDAVWEAIAMLRRCFSQLRLLLITELEGVGDAPLLATMGIAGCLMKHESAESLAPAIRAVAQGETWFGRSAVTQAAAPIEQAMYTGTMTGLTAREWQVLALMARGLSNAEIATKLHLAYQTVRNRVSQIYEKLAVRSRAEAVAWYYQQQPENR